MKRIIMKRIILFLICVMALRAFPGGEMRGFRYWEKLSIAFDEIRVMPGGQLHVRLNGYTEWRFNVKIVGRPSLDSEHDGAFVLRSGEELVFWRTGAPSSSICVLSREDPVIKEMGLPEQMREDHYYLRIRTGGVETLVGSVSQKAYILENKDCIDFPLPFKSVWPNQDDYNLWVSGLGCRYRLSKVGKVSDDEKRMAADLFAYFSSCDLVESAHGEGVTNIQISASEELNRRVPGLVGHLVVQMELTNKEQRVTGFSFLTQDKCRHSRRYRFDSQGHFTWGERIDRTKESGQLEQIVLDMAFEYDANGTLHRAWTPGSNPLMIDKGKKLYFTGDAELAIGFRKDLHRALEGLPAIK